MSKTRTSKTRGTTKSRSAIDAQTAQATRERGTAQDGLLAALRANPHSTTAELAEKAGIGRSTAGKLLARLADEGSVTRISGAVAGGRRRADRWIRGDADDPAVRAQETTTKAARPAPTDPVDESRLAAEPPKESRLAPGGLRDLVLSHLRAHAGEGFGPSQLGKVLGRSAGAINNALEKLAKEGVVAKTVEAPKRFAVTSTNGDAATRTKASR